MSRLLIPAFAVFALATPAALAISGSPTTMVAVVARPGAAGALGIALAAGGQIAMTYWGDRLVLTRSSEPGFVARLYASGALLVVPRPVGGCNPALPLGEMPA